MRHEVSAGESVPSEKDPGYGSILTTTFLALLIFVGSLSSPCASSEREPVLIEVPGTYATIQKGIDAARDGDVVLVSPGTYRESVSFEGKAITVASLLFTGGPPSVADDTIIESAAPGNPVISFCRGEGRTSVLFGFVIRGGSSSSGGGILCSGASPTILHNLITGNRSDREGGGICLLDSRAALRFNRVMKNGSALGGGLFAGPGCEARIHFNVFQENHADIAGGALSASGPQMIFIRGNDFHENSAIRGGGVSVGETASCLLHGNTFSANSAGDGGGIHLALGNRAYVSENRFLRNEAVFGGGLYMTNAGLTRISRAPSASKGGSSPITSLAGKDPSGIREPERGLIRKNLFQTNMASESGGGCCIVNACPAVLENRFLANSALDKGGGLFYRAGGPGNPGGKTLLFRGNTIAHTLSGGGLACDPKARIGSRDNSYHANQGGDLAGCEPGPGDSLPDQAGRQPNPAEKPDWI